MTQKIQATTTIIQGENVLVRASLLSEAGLALTDDGASTTEQVDNADVYVYDTTDDDAPATLVNEGTTPKTDYNVAQVFTSGASPWVTTGWKLGGPGFNAGFTIVHSDAAVASPSVPTVRFKGGHSYRCEFRIRHGGTLAPGLTDGDLMFTVYVYVRAAASRAL